MGILQAGLLEWVAISFFRGSSPPREEEPRSPLSCVLVDGFFTTEPGFFTTEPPGTLIKMKISLKPNTYKKLFNKGLTSSPMVKNPPSNARDTCSIPGQGTEIPHA